MEGPPLLPFFAIVLCTLTGLGTFLWLVAARDTHPPVAVAVAVAIVSLPFIFIPGMGTAGNIDMSTMIWFFR